MRSSVDVAVIQMNSTVDVRANLARACERIEQAARQGASFIALPEFFNCLGPFETVVANAEPIPGPTSDALSALARRLGITLSAGSICEQSSNPAKGYNTNLLIGSNGELLAKYRKIHLFDVDLPGRVSVAESDSILPGDSLSYADCPFARVGLATCYDLRFPSLFGALADAGAEILLVPSAFTLATGQDHWTVLLRARAIENQAFVVAANQVGRHSDQLISYGHSAIIDPWGRVLAMAGGIEETIVTARLDANVVEEVRRELPALTHRRRKLH